MFGIFRSKTAHSNPPAQGKRLSYEESCRRLQPTFVDEGTVPTLPKQRPRHDDEERGINFFRTLVGDSYDASNLTLPRTYFGRSEINTASFRNTDLSESTLCWNDFTDVDFTDACLANSDLRASCFERVRFVRSDLRHADMRRSTFSKCAFDDAEMDGAILTREQGRRLKLSNTQKAVIAWTGDEGSEPEGG